MFIVGIIILLVAGTVISSEVGNAAIKSNVASAQQECILKCQAAKTAILKDGLAAIIKKINMKDKAYVSDVTYVFVMKMDGTMLGHPYKPGLIGKSMINTKDKTGKYFFKEFVKVASEKGSGWVDYMWSKPNGEKPSPKTSYILKVNDKVFVGAGIYQ
jgi:signal transduction histidine kinase